MKANRRAKDEGQLMVVSGIVLVLAFAVTALTLSQIAGLEKQLAASQTTPILAEYRYLREKLGTMLADTVVPSMTNATFLKVFATAQSQLKRLAFDTGYDVQIKLAGSSAALGSSEWSFTDAGYPNNATRAGPLPEASPNLNTNYFLRSHDNKLIWEAYYRDQGAVPVKYDRVNDGILWVNTGSAPRTNGCAVSPGTSCIQGAIVYFYLSDTSITIEEYLVFGFNT